MTQLLPAREKLNTIRQLLERSRPQIAMALPKHLNPDRILRIAMTSVQRVPRLLDCDPVSLVGAVIQAAQLGLEPDGVLGLAYLIPYKNTVTFQPGYKGLLALARRSGEIGAVEARCVYARDAFSYRYGLDPDLRHTPSIEADPGPLAFVYAIVRLKDGGQQWEVMSAAQVDAHRRKYSRATGTDTPWETAPEEMAKKTVLKRALKLAPASVELQHAIAHDEHIDAGLPPPGEASLGGELTAEALSTNAPPAKVPSRLDALTERLPVAYVPERPPVQEALLPEPPPDTMAPPPDASLEGTAEPVEAPEAASERASMLRAVLDAVAAWRTPPSPALWDAIVRAVAQVDDLERADPAVLSDLLAFVQACHRGEKAATLRLSQIVRQMRLARGAESAGAV
jgi:recombination protein RecT